VLVISAKGLDSVLSFGYDDVIGGKSCAHIYSCMKQIIYSTFWCYEVHHGRARCPPHKSFIIKICAS
ncbi:MAG: hypothetical protein ACKO86_05260, partial [Dolichospermum sp.]